MNLRQSAFTLCAVSALLLGAGTFAAQAAPAAGLVQSAPAIAATSTSGVPTPPIQKAHYYHHHWHHHHWHHWHHRHHWRYWHHRHHWHHW